MKKIALIFSYSPYGNSFSQEGLDLLISLTGYTNRIGVFFIGDGILNCIKKQKSKKIYFLNYTKRFKILNFLGIKRFYCNISTLKSRGLFGIKNFFLKINILSDINFKNELCTFDHIINF
ncbi:sulfurtransferase complex subunit TusC [Buchnera aphidicola]|uniref:sulfurtransferase complex subunit TusC n=1 Tax=Buchnera aphidicola TaxID=9 RepID=UPI002238BB7F|nr:sulfurtransferase complex subunit TusC [Buchnera aphidicola]MCW5197473.1 sulfurtransferase complex subunit TusC [Buchnera aphidicola (Chaitophorus viminalis)]